MCWRLTLLDNHEVEHRQVWGDDATPDGLATALAVSAAKATEAAVTRLHQQPDTAWDQDTLLHGEPLLVLAAHDLENVPVKLLLAEIAHVKLGQTTQGSMLERYGEQAARLLTSPRASPLTS